MSDYLAKQMFGDDALYGMVRTVFFFGSNLRDQQRIQFGGLFLPRTKIEVVSTMQLADMEVYLKPMRREEFRGRKGSRIDQAMGDYHFQNAFGTCREDDRECCSCDERKFKP